MSDEPHRDPRYDEDVRNRVAAILAADPNTTVRQMAAQIERSVSRTHALMLDVKRQQGVSG